MFLFYLATILLGVWLVICLYQKYHSSYISVIDRKYVKRKLFFRIFSIIVFSVVLLGILNPAVKGTAISVSTYTLIFIWAFCALSGMRFIYDILGPILSLDFVSKLDSGNFAVYLRSFISEKNCFSNKIESNLCSILKRNIPLFAIGDPSEVLSNIGAERLYASNDDWEQVIINLMLKSKLIIVRPYCSEGCLIELKHISELHLLDKCLFIVTSKEDILTICKYVNIRKTSDLELFADNFPDNKVFSVKINHNGRFSSFVLDQTYDSFNAFLILYGINIRVKAIPINLSLKQHIVDRVSFLLNPLFYASVFEWNLLQVCLVSFYMYSLVLITLFFNMGISHFLMLLFLLLLFFSFLYLIIVAPRISQTKIQFASSTHYMTRVRFLLYFNFIFIFALLLALFNNSQLADSYILFFKTVHSFTIVLLSFLFHNWILALLLLLFVISFCAIIKRMF